MKVIRTQDGSDSLFNPLINESYHSKHGAIQESKHVFIQYGLNSFINENPDVEIIHILEVGFGTGLNAILTALYAKENGRNIFYHGLEAFPVERTLLEKLNYLDKLESEGSELLWNSIHNSKWNHKAQISPYFSLVKENIEVQDFGSVEKFQVCYFDAFAPNKQPEMWEPAVLEKIYQSLTNNGLLVTYCAKGQFKRDLKSVGFEVESLPGPPGKREMVRGRKVN